MHNGSQTILRTWSGIRDNEIDDYLAKSIVVLESLAKAQHVIGLSGLPLGDYPLQDVSVGFGRVELGKRMPFRGPEDVLYDRQSVYIDIQNRGEKMLYVSVFDVCLEIVTLVSASWSTGIELPTKGSECLGKDNKGLLSGLEVSWPADVPRSQQITVTVVLVVSDGPIDLGSLESGSGQRKGSGECTGAGTNLMELIDQIAFGSDRVMSKVMAKANIASLKFGTLQLQYKLAPAKKRNSISHLNQSGRRVNRKRKFC